MSLINCVDIDGSVLEGGGQILRTAVSLSALKQQPVHITNIRAGRPSPGLKSQHMKGIELVSRMCDAKLEGCHAGSTEVTFRPGKIKAGSYSADAETAGSVSLMLQVALLPALFAPGPTNFVLKGGTNADLAPPVDHTNLAYKNILNKFGGNFQSQIKKRGYFPKGQGEVSVNIDPVSHLNAVNLTEFGEIKRIHGYAFVSGKFSLGMANFMANYADSFLSNDRSFQSESIDITSLKDTKAFGDGYGIILCCETTTGCLLVTSSCNKKRYRTEDAAHEAASELVKLINLKSCVDEHTQDQVIMLMALAEGKSRIKTGPVTLHTKTVIHFCEKLLGVTFKIDPAENKCNIIECTGIGFKNAYPFLESCKSDGNNSCTK